VSPESASDLVRRQGRALRSDLVLVLVLAALVRLALLPWLGNLGLAGDEPYYWQELGREDLLVLKPPLWRWLVQGAKAVHDDPLAARALCALIGACTAPLVALLGARVFDRRTGLVAGLAFALYPEFVGYSHYLWAETAFGFLAVLATLLFFRFIEDGRTAWLASAALACGIAWLAKEFAVILFAALFGTLLTRALAGKAWKAGLACLLFALPVGLYSAFASLRMGRVIVLNETGVSSMRQAVGLDPPGVVVYDPERRGEQARELLAHLRQRSPARAFADVRTQFYRLWSANSLVSKRLLGEVVVEGEARSETREEKAERWPYGLPEGWAAGLAILVTWSYVVVMVLGLTGLCAGAPSAFRTFSILCLSFLSCTALLLFLGSRYRMVFLFVPLLHGAHLATSAPILFQRLREPRRALSLLVLMALFAHVVLSERHNIGLWG
jgi:4-amino-4-deoxy-L-arabinose transferase-like glycosyltransferase